MNDNNLFFTVIMPALNEEKNILAAIDNALKAFGDFGITGEIIVVNDGSSDRTGELVSDIMKRDGRIRLIEHSSPQGIGSSFWDGVDNSKGEAVVLVPGDNENDPWEIFRYHKLLEHVDMVIPFVFNTEVRPIYRNMLSYLYHLIINSTFVVNFNYANGTVIYRKSILTELEHRSNGFFFQTDILVRAVKKGYLFAEVPCRLGIRAHGVSRAVSFPSLRQVVKGYARLVGDYYFNSSIKKSARFSEDSLTALRRQAVVDR